VLCVKTTSEKGDFSEANSAEFVLDAQILEGCAEDVKEIIFIYFSLAERG
jgi:hypothetical protein